MNLRTSLLAIAVLLVLVGGYYWYSKSRKEAAETPSLNQRLVAPLLSATFECPDGKSIYAGFSEKSVALALSDGRELTLPQTISGSGARYANEGETIVFWNKGTGAFIEENGVTTYRDCEATPQTQ